MPLPLFKEGLLVVLLIVRSEQNSMAPTLVFILQKRDNTHPSRVFIRLIDFPVKGQMWRFLLTLCLFLNCSRLGVMVEVLSSVSWISDTFRKITFWTGVCTAARRKWRYVERIRRKKKVLENIIKKG